MTLTEPAGYLPYLFSMHASAPIPPNGDEPLGAAEGHTRDYGRFLVATGPYQFLGSENLDFSVPADEQTPVAGYEPGRSVQLVRNPNYDPATDGPSRLSGRVQHLDRRRQQRPVQQGQAGELDGVVDGIVPPRSCAVLDRPDAAAAPAHQPVGRVSVRVVQLAEPPFDDVHIRKAFNLALDKAGMRTFRAGSPSARSPATSW